MKHEKQTRDSDLWCAQHGQCQYIHTIRSMQWGKNTMDENNGCNLKHGHPSVKLTPRWWLYIANGVVSHARCTFFKFYIPNWDQKGMHLNCLIQKVVETKSQDTQLQPFKLTLWDHTKWSASGFGTKVQSNQVQSFSIHVIEKTWHQEWGFYRSPCGHSTTAQPRRLLPASPKPVRNSETTHDLHGLCNELLPHGLLATCLLISMTMMLREQYMCVYMRKMFWIKGRR
jgi:hypothetical protein